MSAILKAIRAKCLDCCGGQAVEVRECHLTGCTLHPYRMGKNPYRKSQEISDARREELAERLASARRANSPEIQGKNERNVA